MSGDPRTVRSRPVAATWLAITGLALSAAACVPAEPQPAGEPVSAARSVAHLAKIEAAAVAGDRQAVQEGVEAFSDDVRRSMRVPDITRPIDPETARAAAKRVPGVRSVVWLDRENLFAIVATNPARSHATIDAICRELDPLGDTLAVVVNLQSGAARTGDELEILSRNCHLAEGELAFLRQKRQVDVVAPEIRRQVRQAND